MKLIDKDVLVAEIEGLFKKAEKSSGEYQNGAIHTLITLKDKLDTLEVKEVDLEKEIDKIWNPRFNLGWDEKSLLSMNHEGFTTIAKYFYELGLKTRKED